METLEGHKGLVTLGPYGRIGYSEEVAPIVAWLVSDAADNLTEATFFVDVG
jgi:NAD(P)-dependent dehydrogenase (short-subunit alcohol dehydrogenase family)